MQTVAIVLSIAQDATEEFETGFRAQEFPIWADLHRRGTLERATLSRMDISTSPVDGAVQYLVSVIFADDEGHHALDDDPRFKAWNARADAFQVAPAKAFGGDTVVSIGEVGTD